jgi:hypothetical protein
MISTISFLVAKSVLVAINFTILVFILALSAYVSFVVISEWLDADGLPQAQSTTTAVSWPARPSSESVRPAKKDPRVLKWLAGIPDPKSEESRCRSARRRRAYRARVAADCERDWEAEFPDGFTPEIWEVKKAQWAEEKRQKLEAEMLKKEDVDRKLLEEYRANLRALMKMKEDNEAKRASGLSETNRRCAESVSL